MNIIDKINLNRFNTNNIEKYGFDSFKSLGWEMKEGQIARFKIFENLGDLNNSSILDVGCGHGDLIVFLYEKYKEIRYYGIDVEKTFLDVAIKKSITINNTAFFEGDFSNSELPFTDYIIACGSLNYTTSEKDYTYKTINKLFNNCRKGFAFNMLSKINNNKNNLLISHESEKIIAYCKSLTNNLQFYEGYYEDDFSILMSH